MNPPEDPIKLRMAPRTSADELAARYAREKRALDLQRETNLSHSLAPFRVGSVPYLNAVPLTRGIEDEILFLPPSELALKLRQNELDAALVSVTEVLFHDQYDILDEIAVASLGEVKSVFLAHRKPLEEVREIFCDPASLTSVTLLKVLLAERGLQPEFKTLASDAPEGCPDSLLLIGDRAISFIRAPHEHKIWDLGAAWFEMTQLPFVYAVWALRRGIENTALRRQLREARSFGLDTLDHIIRHRTEFDLDFRRDYLGWHVHYHLGADEKRGLAKFVELLRKHGMGPVYDPRFVA
jgi:chorismate dehydratase